MMIGMHTRGINFLINCLFTRNGGFLFTKHAPGWHSKGVGQGGKKMHISMNIQFKS